MDIRDRVTGCAILPECGMDARRQRSLPLPRLQPPQGGLLCRHPAIFDQGIHSNRKDFQAMCR